MDANLGQREAPVTRHHVLLVDDEALSVELLKRIFASEPDIEVTGTTSPLAALEVARRQHVDLVIVDQRMPEMSGVDFLIELHRIRPETIPVMLTAFPELSLVIRALNDASTYRFLTKPCDPDTIQCTVRHALDELDLRRENLRLTEGLAKRNEELQQTMEVLHEAHEELVYSEKMAAVGRLCAGVAHELATPVAVLEFEHRGLQNSFGAFTRLMEQVEDVVRDSDGADGAPAAPKQRLQQALDETRRTWGSRDSLAVSARAIGSMRTLISSLRNYSHPGTCNPEPWDVRRGVEETLRLLQHRFAGRIPVVCKFGELQPVPCVGPAIGQVLLNLLSNAADAMEGHSGEIRIEAGCDKDMMRIGVADSGAGMDEATIKQIFRPNFTTKRAGSGTGLGLSICRQIVENHHGRIEVETAPGRGTRFSILLPLQATG